MAPFVIGLVLVIGILLVGVWNDVIVFILSILYHAVMILAIPYQSYQSDGLQTMSGLVVFLLAFNRVFKSSIYNLFNL